jgi:hypothetical protein
LPVSACCLPALLVLYLAWQEEGHPWKNEAAAAPSKDLLFFIQSLHVAPNLARLEEGHRWKNEVARGIAKDLLLFIRPFLGHNLAQ